MLIVSWVAAIIACLGYGVGSVLQEVGARRTAQIQGVTGVALILLQGPYLLGLGADLLAFLANVVALERLPLFLVQSILTASVGVTAVIAWLRGATFRLRDWASLAVLGAGLVLLTLSAAAETAVHVSELSSMIIFASGLIPVALGLVGLRLSGRAAVITLSLASGLGFTGVAVAARGISGVAITPGLLADPMVWTIASQGVVGMIFFALALQRGAVTTVTAITFVVEMVVPSIIGVLLFDDGVAPGLAYLAIGGFVLAIIGTVSLARFAEA